MYKSHLNMALRYAIGRIPDGNQESKAFFQACLEGANDIFGEGSASSGATTSSSSQQQTDDNAMQLNAVNIKTVPNPAPNKTAKAHAERMMAGYRPGGVSVDNRNKQLASNPPEEKKGIVAIFLKFLRLANELQIEIFKAVMESPTVQTIRALLLIPFIPKMLEELKDQDREVWIELNKNDRKFCEYVCEHYRMTFYECLARVNSERAEQERQAQNRGPTQ